VDLNEIFAAGVGLVVTLITWFFNEQSKRSDDVYKQKDIRYQELIKSLRAFYVLTPAEEKVVDTAKERRVRNLELVDQFLSQVALCWLYCSDDVIRKAYDFLAIVLRDPGRTTHEIEQAAGV